MNFIDLYALGHTLEYIAKKQQCDVNEVQQALALALNTKNKLSTLGEDVLSKRATRYNLTDIANELNINFSHLDRDVIERLHQNKVKFDKFAFKEVDNINQCPCCEETKRIGRVVIGDSSGAKGEGRSQGRYCLNCGTEYIIKGKVANIINWEYVKKMYD